VKDKIAYNICPGCGEMVYSNEDKFLQASDRPVYKNIFWHMDCWKLRKSLKEQDEK